MNPPYTVLVLDDDVDHQESIRRAFDSHREQFTLEQVETIRQAKASIRKRTPHLAIIDWRLSDGSGMELLPGYGRPAVFPVILMTSYGSSEAEVDVLSKGAVDYIEKDVPSLRRLPDLCIHVLRFWRHLNRERELNATVIDRAHRLADLGMVAAGMVHDLNNKLAAIKRAGELALEDLQKNQVTKDTVDFVETAVDSAKKSQELTKRILENAFREHRKRIFDLVASLDAISRTLRAIISGAVEIELEIAETEYRNVQVDPLELELVITNLVKNAEEALGNRSGKIRLTLDEVYLPSAENPVTLPPGYYFRLRVQDNGQGIAKEKLPLIFEQFFTTKPKGTGLGLPRAKSFVEQCGGAITVQSRWHEGSTFSVYLPPCLAPLPEVPAQSDLSLCIQGERELILVVDDEDSLLPGLTARLERWNYRVKTFNDSELARDYILNHAGEVNLVLTDYLMPGLTGTKLRKSLLASGIPMPRMILMTGRQDKMNPTRAKQEGFDDYVEKPGDDPQLSRMIRTVLAKVNSTETSSQP